MTVTEKNQLFLKIIFCFFRFSIFAQFLRRPKAKSVKASNMAPSTEIVAVEDTPREEAPSTSVIAELSTSPTPLKDHPGGAQTVKSLDGDRNDGSSGTFRGRC